MLFEPTLSIVDGEHPKQLPHCLSMPVFSAISKFEQACWARVQLIEAQLLIKWGERVFLFFHSVFHRAVEMASRAN